MSADTDRVESPADAAKRARPRVLYSLGCWSCNALGPKVYDDQSSPTDRGTLARRDALYEEHGYVRPETEGLPAPNGTRERGWACSDECAKAYAAHVDEVLEIEAARAARRVKT